MISIQKTGSTVAEVKTLMAVLGKTWWDRIEYECAKGISPYASSYKKGQTLSRWQGHEECVRLPRLAFDWITEGARPRGRPRKRWKHNIQEKVVKYRPRRLDKMRWGGCSDWQVKGHQGDGARNEYWILRSCNCKWRRLAWWTFAVFTWTIGILMDEFTEFCWCV